VKSDVTNPDQLDFESRILKLEKIPWETALNFLQDDDFKVSTEEEYQKVVQSFAKKHWIAPFFVWQDPEGKIWCMDGKRRDTILRRIKQAGGATVDSKFIRIQIPELLDALFIQADSKSEAAEYVLAYSSTYGKITYEGFHSFLDKFSINYDNIRGEVNFPDFSTKKPCKIQGF
jgi:hypothetical protein